jgi:hypothetical protein
MSAFLGPIHYWLYDKISLQQEINRELYQLGAKHGLPLQQECEDRWGTFSNQPLESQIDTGNIHGWLQEQVAQAERQYAYSVTSLSKLSPDPIASLMELMEQTGSEQAKVSGIPEAVMSPKEIFTLLSDRLLDGMPCDHANRIVAQTDAEVIWSRNLCVHTPYWEELQGDISLYYQLREAWMKGFLKEYHYALEKVDDVTYRAYPL